MNLATKQFIIFSVLAFLSIMFIDKPLALFIHSKGIDNLLFLRYITEGLPFILPYIALLLVAFVRPQVYIGKKPLYILYLVIITKLTIYSKDLIKAVFSRYWPKTWIHENLSLIHDNIYGFNWFGGFAFNGGAFPSGHTTFIAIICLSLAITYPQYRKIWFFLIGLIILSLVMLDFHFLGDCFGGLALASLFSGIGFKLYIYLIHKFTKPVDHSVRHVQK